MEVQELENRHAHQAYDLLDDTVDTMMDVDEMYLCAEDDHMYHMH